MKKMAKSVILVLCLICFLMASNSMAAGYEVVYLHNNIHNEKIRSCNEHTKIWSALKEASLVERVPNILDDVAGAVRALLSQLGVDGQ